MPWINFSQDFEFRPKKRVIQTFKAGSTKLVTEPCALAAINSGKGSEVDRASSQVVQQRKVKGRGRRRSKS